MKIGILTFHRAWNFGAVLQAYALQQHIQRQGHTCEIVDYRNAHLEYEHRLFPGTGGSLKKFLGRIANFPVRFKRKNAFRDFREKYINTGQVFTDQNIQQANAVYDGFLFGSDQIWNHELTGSDLNYFGAFVSQKYKRNAYAASFGETAIPELLAERYALELLQFGGLAVREQSGKDRVQKLIGRSAQIVVDPVFLLGAEQWQQVAAKRKSKGKYILLCHLKGKSTRLIHYAQYLSKVTGYPIVELQAWAKIRRRNVKPRYGDSPNEFLNWVQNAEYIITDSFHCTAFSIIFEKDVWAGIDPKEEKEKTRIGNLLFTLGLQGRILPGDLTNWEYSIAPDYSAAREILEVQINHSCEYLNSVLDGIQQKNAGMLAEF